LVRYAGACGDWNPIHWDHDSARAAGLSGTIVHGLLMAAWMANSVCRLVLGDDPLREARVRFRNPLRPGVAAVVTGEVATDDGHSPVIDLALESGGDRLASGRIRVTP
jgi:acyl dehydratase